MTPEFAELLGMHAGDGTIYKTQNSVVWELRGGLEEKEFYNKYVVSLLAKITKIQFFPKFRSGGKNGCYGIRTCNKIFIQKILNEGFPVGKKTHTVEIPENIIDGNKEVQAAFLRGLFATDGCAYLGNNKKYPLIEVVSTSFRLIEQTSNLLSNFNIKCYTWTYKPRQRGDPAKFLRISGFERCRKFQRDIGFSNPKHSEKMYILGNL